VRYDYVRVDLMRDDGGLAQSGFMNIFIRDHTLSLTELGWTNFVYNFNPFAWSGVEVFFKRVDTTTQDKLWSEKQTSYLTYDYQYTRFDTQTSWASEATQNRSSVLSFYLRSSLRMEKNIVSPELRMAGLLAEVGGMWVTWEGVILVVLAMVAPLLVYTRRVLVQRHAVTAFAAN
jgi:hypothetical protein